MSILFQEQYYVLHIAIFLIAATLIGTIIHEMRKPVKDPDDDPDTKRMNDILRD